MTAHIIDFQHSKNRRYFAKVTGYESSFADLALGEKVEFLLENGSTCAGWKSSQCDLGPVYWANDILNGGFRRVFPIGWKLLPVNLREPA